MSSFSLFYTNGTPGDAAPQKSTASLPNVVVTPPEEEDSPAWCCFDASQPNITDGPRERVHSIAELEPFSAPSTENAKSVVDSLHEHDRDVQNGFDAEAEEDDAHAGEIRPPETPRSYRRNPADDSDVIEVIKVRRRDAGENDFGVISPGKRNKTLKKHASRAFRSFKSLRSRQRTDENLLHEISPPPPMPSQGTQTLPKVKSRGSIMALFNKPPPIEIRPMPASQEPGNDDELPPSPSSWLSVSHSDVNDEEAARLEAASPSPTATSSKFPRRRFSVFTLAKLFGNNSRSPSQASLADEVPVTAPPSDSASSSITTPSTPQSPISTNDERTIVLTVEPDTTVFDPQFNLATTLDLRLSVDSPLPPAIVPKEPDTSKVFESSRPPSWIMSTPKRHQSAPLPVKTPVVEKEGIDLQLDSLHFDSISFDPDRFEL